MNTFSRIYTFLFALMMVASSCSDEQETIVVDPAVGEYVSAYTTGMIPRNSEVRIRLTKALPELAEANTPLKEGLLSFKPAISGKATWIDQRTIGFVPAEPLPSGAVFTASLQLGDLMEVPDNLKTFKFQFSTIAQDIEVNINGMESYSDTKLEWQMIKGEIVAADLLDTAKVNEILVAYQGTEKRPLNIRLDEGVGNIWSFTIDSVVRRKNQGFVMLDWFGSPVGVDKTGSQRIDIPALGDFHIMDVDVTMEPEQMVEIYFTDPIKRRQDLNGIITLGSEADLTYEILGNKVTVYPANPLSGTFTLNVSRGLKNALGYRMSNEDTRDIVFEDLKPNLKLANGSGTILPNSNGLLLPFEAVNLKAVDVQVTQIYEKNMLQFLQVNRLDGEYQLQRVGKKVFHKTLRLDDDKKVNLSRWNNFAIDLQEIVKAEPGAMYQVKLRYNKEHAICDCETEENTVEAEPMPELPEGADSWTEETWSGYYDEDYYYWYDEDYNYRERDNPCNSAYYRNATKTKNILASDLGILAKAGDDKRMHVFVNNIIDTKPISGAKVTFYDFQQNEMASTTTNKDGMVEMYLEEKPFAIVTSHNNQRGYLTLRDGNSLSMSKFDVEGEAVNKGLKGFIYGERGVWRPGDSLYVSFIMQDKENLIPADHPISFELTDPRGQVVERMIRNKSLNGFYDFRTATHAEAPTGNYTGRVKVGNRTFTKRFRIETVKPNRLKIYLDFGGDVVKVVSQQPAKMNVKWLHGAIAGNLKTRVELALKETNTSFKAFKGYSFDDPVKKFNTDDRVVYEGQTDADGNVTFEPSINVGAEAPGMLTGNFTTKVFEKGGGFSIDRYSVTYSPYQSYVGVKVPEGDLYRGTLVTGKEHEINIASVTEEGEKTSRKDLEVKVYHLRWRWWWDRYDNSLASYLSNASTVPVMEKKVRTSSGKGSFKFKVDQPNWGRYLVLVKDPVSGHTAGKIFYVDWPYWARANRTDNEFATMLNFSADKEAYNVGEKVKVSFPSASEGRALFCVETGTKIIHKQWIQTTKGETKFEFAVTEDMAPNVFLHLSLLQPHAATENDLPVRLYGVIPISVENPNTHLQPEIEMPEVLRPETTVSVKVSESKGRRMTYTLAMVDEGLLDLTRFKTPDPWSHFYAREAHGVKTWDMYDEVIGANNGRFERILSIGGDGAAKPDNKAAKANRFEPVVRFLGPFELEANGTATHKIKLPNYVGSVRVMVVAGQDGAYGNAEKTVPVRSPLMVLGTLPRVLGPGETVQLPVNVFAMEGHVKDVSVSVDASDIFEPLGPTKQTIKFDKPGDQVVNFPMRVKESIGIGKVKIAVSSGKERAKHEIELDVRNPNPRVRTVQHTVVMPGNTWEPTVQFTGVKGTNEATVEISSMPPIDLGRRLNYLIRYPHGCIEQTTSSVFPQLYVHDVSPLSKPQRNKVADNIKAGIERLKLFQTNQGGFAYWPGKAEDSEWGTNYAGHFMLEAEKAGYRVPSNLKTRWKAYQKQAARAYIYERGDENFHGLDHNKDLTQAYRLYTLALAGAPELSAMNRLRENPDLSASSRWRLAAAYALIGQREVAENLVHGVGYNMPEYKELSYTYGSTERDEAMILETMLLIDSRGDAAVLSKRIAERLSDENRWMNTQSTAYCLMTMARYYGDFVKTDLMEFNLSVGKSDVITKRTQAAVFKHQVSEQALNNGGRFSFTNNGDAPLYISVEATGIPVTGDQSSSSSNVNMLVRYETVNGETLDPTKIEQGTDFVAVVRISNPGTRGNLKEMALTQIFPSGWEIHNARMDAEGDQENAAEYQDIRDDRVYTYYDLRKNRSATYRIKLNATYLGKYYLPTVSTEAMYDHTIHAHQAGQWVEVVQQGTADVGR